MAGWLSRRSGRSYFFFCSDTATTEIYTLSLHDALPISKPICNRPRPPSQPRANEGDSRSGSRSEEHTSELQSRLHLVCRLLLEKKKKELKTLLKVATKKTQDK